MPPCFMSTTLAAGKELLGVKCHCYTSGSLAALQKIKDDPFVANGDAKFREGFSNLVKDLHVGVYKLFVDWCLCFCFVLVFVHVLLCFCCLCVFASFCLFVGMCV